MTILEYIRQFPGVKNKEKYGLPCPDKYGLDHEVCTFDSYCDECYEHDATINGEPAPYIFACPVKPGQTVYHPNPDDGRIYEDTVLHIIFGAVGWMVECENKLCFWAPAWNTLIFPTREAAEAKLAEMRGDADGK